VTNGVLFEVRLTADPAPTVIWYKGDTVVKDGGRITTSIQTDGLSWTLLLEISGVTKEDGGSYKVNAKNKHGESNANINLNLEAPKTAKIPTFLGAPSISQQGSVTIMLVTVESETEPVATWLKGASPVNSGGRITMITKKITSGQYSISCEIKDPSADDGGSYKCIVKNEGGEAVANINLNTVQKKDEKKTEKKKKEEVAKVVEPVVSGEPVVTSSSKKIVVRYIVESASEPKAAWSIGGKAVKSGGRYNMTVVKVSQGYEVSIEVDKPTAQDAGAYKCTITNEAGKIVKSTTVEAPVEEKVEKKTEVKQETEKTNDEEAGDKKKVVKKVKKKTEDKDKPTENAVNEETVAKKTTAKTEAAKKTTDAKKETPKEPAKPGGDAPVIEGSLEDCQLQVGASQEYKLNIKGTAPITVGWTRDGQKVRSSGTMKVGFVRGIAKLHIMDAQPEHTGVYKVEAVNNFGEATRTVEVTVMTAEKMKMKKPKQKAKGEDDEQDWPDLKAIPLKKTQKDEPDAPTIEDVRRGSTDFNLRKRESVDLEAVKKPPPREKPPPKKEPSPPPKKRKTSSSASKHPNNCRARGT
jgi:hypothetical protein